MSIWGFFKPINSIPDTKGSLSSTMPSAAIVSSNRDVLKVIKPCEKKRPVQEVRKTESSIGSVHVL